MKFNQMQATASPTQSAEKVELVADSVEVFNNRADTSTTSGAKTFGLEPDNNDEILGIKPKDTK